MPIARAFGLNLDHDGFLRGLPEAEPRATADVVVRRVRSEEWVDDVPRSVEGSVPPANDLLDTASASPQACSGEATGRFASTRDEASFHWPSFARIVLHGLDRIEVDAHPAADPDQLQAAVLGPVCSVLLGRRGAFPLHASALVLGSAAVAFAGSSGAGKSTLAAALAARGHGFLSDDVCALLPRDRDALQAPIAEPDGSTCWQTSKPVHVWPSYPQQKLARTALGHLTPHRQAEGPLVNPDEGKHLVDLERPMAEQPVRLERLFLLERCDAASPGLSIERLSPAAALGPLLEHVHRAPLLHHALGTRTLFERAARLAQDVIVERLRRPFSFAALDEVLEAIERHVTAERAA